MHVLLSLLLAMQFFFQMEVPPLPEVHVDMAVVIDVLSEYSVVMEDNPTFCSQYYGSTDPDNRTITICDRIDSVQKKETLLHEILHVVYRRAGYNTGGPYEPQIKQKAQELYLKLYGQKTQEEVAQ